MWLVLVDALRSEFLYLPAVGSAGHRARFGHRSYWQQRHLSSPVFFRIPRLEDSQA